MLVRMVYVLKFGRLSFLFEDCARLCNVRGRTWNGGVGCVLHGALRGVAWQNEKKLGLLRNRMLLLHFEGR